MRSLRFSAEIVGEEYLRWHRTVSGPALRPTNTEDRDKVSVRTEEVLCGDC